MSEDNLLKLGPAMDDAPVSPSMGVAMIALNFALKFHDINTVQDGTLYQQYKLEGKNMLGLHLDHVFETAKRIELHLLVSSHEITKMMVEGVIDAMIAGRDEAEEGADAELEQDAGEPGPPTTGGEGQ